MISLKLSNLLKLKKHTLAVIGIANSGKKNFLAYYNQQQNNKFSPQAIFTLSVKPDPNNNGFEILDANKNIATRKTTHLVGKSADVTLFFFNIDAYFKNEIIDNQYYQKLCNEVFEYLQHKVNPNDFLVVATHFEKCDLTVDVTKRTFKNYIDNKSYKKIFKQMLFINGKKQDDLDMLTRYVNTL